MPRSEDRGIRSAQLNNVAVAGTLPTSAITVTGTFSDRPHQKDLTMMGVSPPFLCPSEIGWVPSVRPCSRAVRVPGKAPRTTLRVPSDPSARVALHSLLMDEVLLKDEGHGCAVQRVGLQASLTRVAQWLSRARRGGVQGSGSTPEVVHSIDV